MNIEFKRRDLLGSSVAMAAQLQRSMGRVVPAEDQPCDRMSQYQSTQVATSSPANASEIARARIGLPWAIAESPRGSRKANAITAICADPNRTKGAASGLAASIGTRVVWKVSWR